MNETTNTASSARPPGTQEPVLRTAAPPRAIHSRHRAPLHTNPLHGLLLTHPLTIKTHTLHTVKQINQRSTTRATLVLRMTHLLPPLPLRLHPRLGVRTALPRRQRQRRRLTEEKWKPHILGSQKRQDGATVTQTDQDTRKERPVRRNTNRAGHVGLGGFGV